MFHHFTEVEHPFSEMSRVLKKSGKLVVIDMEAAEEKLREIEDRLPVVIKPYITLMPPTSEEDGRHS